jgi:hypothetical protein
MKLNYSQELSKDSREDYADRLEVQVLVSQQAEIQRAIQEIEREEAVLREQLLNLKAIERLED